MLGVVVRAAMAEEGERKAALETVQADGTDGNCVTFVLHDEDHTLGNSLRYMVMKNPDVEFCGYCITHPSESKINFRIQTRGGLPAVEPFRKGLNDLMGVCQHVLNTFEQHSREDKPKPVSPVTGRQAELSHCLPWLRPAGCLVCTQK
ncbi:DNA-directed RNA polymerases I and III subunit RPAC2-like isoform X1 [Accipiter gentilis]|uniref:DNA-directed RNA polymerases I and III subunit RPAC2-like isoform X1 n=1 Tax=Astur gentilis TaxID=8957 RepID=UPI0021104F62|nr:DNA-directed RNA polymerases I and III subunit RPAC2-like isoform X1 [Accipiter gentilis]